MFYSRVPVFYVFAFFSSDVLFSTFARKLLSINYTPLPPSLNARLLKLSPLAMFAFVLLLFVVALCVAVVLLRCVAFVVLAVCVAVVYYTYMQVYVSVP